jgi:predicted DNA-binding WGR domain protein
MLIHRRDPAKRMFRFYRLRFQLNLWGGTALVRE